MSALRGNSKRAPYPLSDQMIAAVRLVREGQPRREVARLYGVAVTTIEYWMARVTDEERLSEMRKEF